MRRRSIVTGIGVLMLVSLPFLSEPYLSLAQGASVTVLIVAGVIHLVAFLPVKVWVGLLRLGVLALGGVLLRQIAIGAVDFRQLATISAFAVGILACFVLSVGPIVSVGFRRSLYLLVLVLGWGELACIFATQDRVNLSDFFLPVSGMLLMSAAYRRWSKGGQSYVVELLERWRRESQEFLARYDSPAPVLQKVREQWNRQRLSTELLAMSGASFRSREGYEALLRTCREYPHSALAWQIAYTVTLSKRDFAEAAKVVAEAQANGYEGVLGDRALAVALRGSYDPTWRKVLTKEPQLGAALGKVDTFEFGIDPSLVWRERDPVFARLYQHLAEAGPLNLPVEMARG